jgi:hypothetical protein
LRKERRLRVFENGVLRRIFGPKGRGNGGVEKTNTQYFSGDKIEKNVMGGSCSTYGREERRVQGFGGET